MVLAVSVSSAHSFSAQFRKETARSSLDAGELKLQNEILCSASMSLGNSLNEQFAQAIGN